MTKYYKQLNESGEVVVLLTYDFIPVITDPKTVEITEEEYAEILAEIAAASEQEAEENADEVSEEEFVDMLEAVL